MKINEWVDYDEIGQVRIMAIAEGWAMVRRKGMMPFLVKVKELEMKQKKQFILFNYFYAGTPNPDETLTMR